MNRLEYEDQMETELLWSPRLSAIEGETALPGAPAERDYVRSQIAANQRDAGKLTDAIFYRRHPAMAGKLIQQGQTDLADEWLTILRTVVQPMLAGAPSTAQPVSAGKHFTCRSQCRI